LVKSYLILEKGLLEERAFPVEDRVTIGRSPLNTINIADSSVSRQHAAVYWVGDQVIIEDLDSHNGTFVNDERVRRAALATGDNLRVGRIRLRFVQERLPTVQATASTQEMAGPPQMALLQSTQEIMDSSISVAAEEVGPPRRSRRLSDALSKTPLFASLDADALNEVGQAARLMVFDRGRTIVRQGDRGKSLFVILDGKARMFMYDQEGKEIPLGGLTENQFFGEMSLLTGAPANATVQAVEESLCCELNFEAMRDILARMPEVRGVLERYYQDRLQQVEAKKRAAGVIDRRKHPRINEVLSISFSVSPTPAIPSHFRGKLFRSVSKDISLSGVRVRVQDRLLMGLPMGAQLRLEIALPQAWGSVRCLGILRNIISARDGQDLGYLGIEFSEIPAGHRRRFEQFVRGEPA
jgi:CRP-like cAMP-binding protein